MENLKIEEIEQYFISCKKSDRECEACETHIQTCCTLIVENKKRKMGLISSNKLNTHTNF